MGASDPVTNHVQKLDELKNELSTTDTYIKDKEFIAIVLNSLLDSYQNIVMSFFVFSK